MLRRLAIKMTRGWSIEGSLWGILLDLRSLLRNLRGSLLHLWTYHFRRAIREARKVHFGCGRDLLDGFCNVDLYARSAVRLDARNRTPFRDGSISFVYSSHLVEHLEPRDLLFHLAECRRILEPGGLLRLAVPDFAAVFRAYLDRDARWLESVKKLRPLTVEVTGIPEELVCYADYLDAAVHEFGEHRVCLDFERLRNLCVLAGFDPAGIGEGTFDPSVDSELRRPYSFYLLARR
ncbi:hypothetical protein GMSM_20800 [Geomonas sp. Red276]